MKLITLFPWLVIAWWAADKTLVMLSRIDRAEYVSEECMRGLRRKDGRLQ